MLGGSASASTRPTPGRSCNTSCAIRGAKIIVCGDQEQTDKVLDAARNEGGLPDLTTIISVDMKGMRHYAEAGLHVL